MLESLVELLFRLLNPISLIAWIVIVIAFEIPWEYLGLFICGVIATWAIFSFPFNIPYVDPGHFDLLGEIMTNSATWILSIGILATIIIRFKNGRNEPRNLTKSKAICAVTFAAYGVLVACFYYLLGTNLFKNYQPAWEAYLFLILGLLLIASGSLWIARYIENANFVWLKNLQFFVYSFCLTITLVIMGSWAFSIVALIQTKDLIRNYSGKNIQYCIQKDSRGINSWLELTPLTTWNKPVGNSGAATRHAVLVVRAFDRQSIYHWSYRSREWKYNSSEFEPDGRLVPSSLDCVPETDYLNKLPLLFSKVQTLSLKHKSFQIPVRYFPKQFKVQDNTDKIISFSASLPNFKDVRHIFHKLPEQIIEITDVNISYQTNENNIEKSSTAPYSELKLRNIKSEYGLRKRSIPQTKYKYKYKKGIPFLTQKIEQHIQYYQRQKGVVKTSIYCNPYQMSRLNCRHQFIDRDLQYSFSHSDRDVKNWRKLQKRLIEKVESWELRS